MTTRKEITSSLVVILFGTGFLFYTAKYPLDTLESPGPGVFPMIVGGILTILAMGHLVQSLWKSKSHHDRGKQRKHGGSVRRFLRENKGETKALFMIGVFILYILMMKWIGFFVSTFLFAIISSRLSEARDWGRPVALSAGINLFCYLLFEVWLKLSLPRGLFF